MSDRPSRPLYRVFVSSTWLDLQAERHAVLEALQRMEEMRFVGMEYFGTKPDDTQAASLDQVRACDLFLGIIAGRYGSGITHDEYTAAQAARLPCFIYFKASPDLTTDNDPALAAQLADLKAELQQRHTIKTFRSPAELAANVATDLHNWVAAHWVSSVAGARRPPPADFSDGRRNLLRLLDRVEQDWLQGVLEASLHRRAWLELGFDWRSDAVQLPWDRLLIAPNTGVRALASGEAVHDVFTAGRGMLLVLGEPGGGKTTTLLELAKHLCASARASPDEPIPVVFALTQWTPHADGLAGWLGQQLVARYQVPKKLAQKWVEDVRLVYLLDGLDELPSAAREQCVAAINAFIESTGAAGMVVTCRVNEYAELRAKVELSAAICLQPLTDGQIERYFATAGPALASVHHAVQHDTALRELARSPLMLSVMTLSATATEPAPAASPLDEGPASPAQIAARRAEIFERFIASTGNRLGKAASPYRRNETIAYLSVLAEHMRARSATIFSLEHLQPDWISSRLHRLLYYVSTRLLAVLFLSLPFLGLPVASRVKSVVVLFATFYGAGLGLADFVLASLSRVRTRDTTRFALMFLSGLLALFALLAVFAISGQHDSAAFAACFFFMAVGAMAMWEKVDVRVEDIRPAGAMRWSWQRATERALGTFGLIQLGLAINVVLGVTVYLVAGGDKARDEVAALLGLPHFLVGAAIGAVALWWIRPPSTWTQRGVRACFRLAIVSLAGQLVAAVAHPAVPEARWMLLIVLGGAVICAAGLGGLAPEMAHLPGRRRRGAWFWLATPVTGAVATFALVLAVSSTFAVSRARSSFSWSVLVVCALCAGLIAFFRLRGFDVVRHLVLRFFLQRKRVIHREGTRFYDVAVQGALLQKVGSGYRFIHALLLDHFADKSAARR